jgi:hypothetical protein
VTSVREGIAAPALMPRLSAFALLLASLPVSVLAQSTQVQPSPAPAAARDDNPRAIIDSAGARFAFPIPNRSVWAWAQSTMPVDQAEYDWTVQVHNGGRDFTFGFLYFKAAGATPSQGSIEDLLRAGQESVALISAGQASLLDSAVVDAVARHDTLWIRVRQQSTLTLLFSDRPRTAVLTTILPGQTPDSVTVPVVYR